jgi:hypothetical protein
MPQRHRDTESTEMSSCNAFESIPKHFAIEVHDDAEPEFGHSQVRDHRRSVGWGDRFDRFEVQDNKLPNQKVEPSLADDFAFVNELNWILPLERNRALREFDRQSVLIMCLKVSRTKMPVDLDRRANDFIRDRIQGRIRLHLLIHKWLAIHIHHSVLSFLHYSFVQ